MARLSKPRNWFYRFKQLTSASMVCTAVVFLAACGGGGTALSPTVARESPSQELTASAPGELLRYATNMIKEGVVQGMYSAESGFLGSPGIISTTQDSLKATNFSGTSLQEQDVDEDDLVKTDGNMLYALTKAHWSGTTTVAARLQAQKTEANGQLVAAGSLELGNSNSLGMYLASAVKRIALLGQQHEHFAPTLNFASDPIVVQSLTEKIGIDVVSLEKPGTLTIATRVRIDGRLVGSRMINNTLYVVSTWSPNLG